jgi:hypothetical protein
VGAHGGENRVGVIGVDDGQKFSLVGDVEGVQAEERAGVGDGLGDAVAVAESSPASAPTSWSSPAHSPGICDRIDLRRVTGLRRYSAYHLNLTNARLTEVA